MPERVAGGADVVEGPGAPIYRRLRERLSTILHSCDVLRAAVPSDPLAESIHTAARALEPEIEALRKTRSLPPESEIDLLQGRIDHIERALLTLDAAVPMLLFRHRVDPDLFPRSVIAGYITLLAMHLEGDADRRDRIDLLITSLCSLPDAKGLRRMRPRKEVADLLERISLGHRAGPDRREATLEFFKRARWQIARVADPESIFEEGLYADVYGLKLVLGRDFLDPDILYAVAELNVTLGNRLSEAKAAEAEVVETEEQVREALATSHDSPELVSASRFERLRAEGRLQVDDVASHKAWKAIRRRNLVRIAGVLVMLLGLGSTYMDQPKRPREVALPLERVHALSDILTTADLIGGPGPRVVEAEVDDFAWDHMDAKERQAEGRVLARELQRQLSVDTAMLRREGRLVLLIQRGRVVFVSRARP